MERLTDRGWREMSPFECGADLCQCRPSDGCTKCRACLVPRLYARLAAYEDSGLDPDARRILLRAKVKRRGTRRK